MGVSWHSHAEVISLEPEKIKQLIEEINNDNNYNTASIRDLRIKDNSVFFNSGGYGCYSYEEGYKDLLFKILLEKYEGAIACFEYVQPCQSQGYYFATSWIKSEGEVDWDDEENCLINKEALIINEDILDDDQKETINKDSQWIDDFLDFELALVWSINVDSLLKRKNQMPSLYSIYQKCGSDEAIITISLLYDWGNNEQISEDELDSAIDECELDCKHLSQDLAHDVGYNILTDFQGELPDNFPQFKTMDEIISKRDD